MSCIIGEQAGYIDTAVQEWMKQTCVTFEKRQPTDFINSQYLFFTNANSG